MRCTCAANTNGPKNAHHRNKKSLLHVTYIIHKANPTEKKVGRGGSGIRRILLLTNTHTMSAFNSLSIGSGPVTAVGLCIKYITDWKLGTK